MPHHVYDYAHISQNKIAQLIDKALMNHNNEVVLTEIRNEVNAWMKSFPLY